MDTSAKHADVAKPQEQSLLDADRRRGRGARSNRVGRYEQELRVEVDDGWESLATLEAFRTEVKVELAKSIISTNDSPDISFDQSFYRKITMIPQSPPT